MDRYVSATEANQRFSEILRDVQRGETVVVTSRGQPVVQMTPIARDKTKKSTSAFLDFLRSQPIIQTGRWKREDLYDRSDRDLP